MQMYAFLAGHPIILGNKSIKQHTATSSATGLSRIRLTRRPSQAGSSSAEKQQMPSNWPVQLPEGAVEAASLAADRAGQVIRRYFRNPSLKVEDKSDESPVTLADREAEMAIRVSLQADFPDWPVLGEEGGLGKRDDDLSEGWSWVVDPIDGTKAFVTGKPTFGTLIALLKDGVPVLGIIDQPIANERWVGGAGIPTTLNREPARVRQTLRNEDSGNVLEDVFVNATTPDMFIGNEKTEFDHLVSESKMVLYGSDCYAYGLLASGSVQLVAEADMKPWDYLALVPIVLSAGGYITDWSGNDLTIKSGGTVLASSDAVIHAAAIAALGHRSTVPTHDPGPGQVESMTGYGQAEVTIHGKRCKVELQSVNSRYCEVKVRLPRKLLPFEHTLSSMMKIKIKRGKVVASISLSDEEPSSKPIHVDEEALDRLYGSLRVVSEKCMEDLKIAHLLQFSDVFISRNAPLPEAEVLPPVVTAAIDDAVNDLQASRRKEGRNLEKDILDRCFTIESELSAIETAAPERVAKEQRRLLDKISALQEVGDVEQSLVEREIVLYADNVDITEETVRLASHLALFRETFADVKEPVGPRLNFMIHEMQRESTTIAAKCRDAGITQSAVQIKQELERIREQVQNVA